MTDMFFMRRAWLGSKTFFIVLAQTICSRMIVVHSQTPAWIGGNTRTKWICGNSLHPKTHHVPNCNFCAGQYQWEIQIMWWCMGKVYVITYKSLTKEYWQTKHGISNGPWPKIGQHKPLQQKNYHWKGNDDRTKIILGGVEPEYQCHQGPQWVPPVFTIQICFPCHNMPRSSSQKMMTVQFSNFSCMVGNKQHQQEAWFGNYSTFAGWCTNPTQSSMLRIHSPAIRATILQQDEIGWYQFLLGHPSNLFTAIQDAY